MLITCQSSQLDAYGDKILLVTCDVLCGSQAFFHLLPSSYIYSALVWTIQCSHNLCYIVGPPLLTPLVQPPPPPAQASRPQHNAQPQTGDCIGHFGCFGNLILI